MKREDHTEVISLGVIPEIVGNTFKRDGDAGVNVEEAKHLGDSKQLCPEKSFVLDIIDQMSQTAKNSPRRTVCPLGHQSSGNLDNPKTPKRSSHFIHKGKPGMLLHALLSKCVFSCYW